jgi:hypothetical protein
MQQDKKRNNQGVVVLAYIIYIAAFMEAFLHKPIYKGLLRYSYLMMKVLFHSTLRTTTEFFQIPIKIVV